MTRKAGCNNTDLEQAYYYKRRSFGVGYTIKTKREALFWATTDGGDGNYYIWTGALPKTVPAGSTPVTTGGVATGAWQNVRDGSFPVMLKSPFGSKEVGYLKSTLYRKLKESVSVQDYMTEEEIADANSLTGTMNHSQAFRDAFADSKVVEVPPVLGQYRVGDVVVPNYTTIWGQSSVVYNGYLDTHFNGLGSVIRLATGATNMFVWGHRCTLDSLIFDGFNRRCPFFARSGTGNLAGIRAQNCGFYRFSVIGGATGTYTGMMLSFCNINQNTVGLYNPLDSMILGCTINANTTHGANCQTGANNNTFISTRNEWNLGHNFTFYQSTENTIIGELCDASGLVGINLIQSTCNVVGVRIKRSGRQAFTGETPIADSSCHFRLEGAGSRLYLTNVVTETGVDDVGGSNLKSSPQYVFRTTGSSTDMTISGTGSVLNGFVTAQTSSITAADNVNLIGNIGSEDRVTSGLTKISNGKRYIASAGVSITGINSASVTLTKGAVPANAEYLNRIEITTRNASTTERNSAVIDLLSYKDSGNAVLRILGIKSYPEGIFGTVGTETYVVSIENVSADGSSFDLKIQATAGTQTIRFLTFVS